MEIPHELFYLSIFFFAVMVVVAFSRAYRERNRVYYVGVGLCLLGTVWSILFVLDQVLLAAIVWLAAMIISIVMLPELTRFQDSRMKEVDIASPLRATDFFSNTYDGWLKLADRRGLGVTVILYILQFFVISGVFLLVLNLFYDLPPEFMFIILSINIYPVIRFYKQIKRALTSIRLPSGSPPSSSML